MIRDVKDVSIQLWSKELIGLAQNFDVNPDSCSNSDFYRSYLCYSALFDQSSGQAVTHVIIDEEKQRIMGFVTLRASSMLYRENNKFFGDPAIEVEVLAVDRNYERRGVGSTLIDIAILEARELQRSHVGVRYITLAADAKAISFYKRRNFLDMEASFSREMPREHWSKECHQMYMELQTEEYETYANFDNEYDD